MSKGHSHKTSSKSAAPMACRTPESVARQLDDELEQSFPASDPPSMVRDAPARLCGEKEKAAKKPARHGRKH